MRQPNVRGLIAAGVAIAATAALLVAGPAGAADPAPRIDLRVLVVTDGSTVVDALTAQLEREGVPYEPVDLRVPDRKILTAETLTRTANHGRYQGVVVPSPDALPTAEAEALASYESTFGVRRIVAYTWAGPHVGLSTAWAGTLDGGTLTVTDAARAAGFGYLAGTVPVDDRSPEVAESYAGLGIAAPGADFTALVEAQAPGRRGARGAARWPGSTATAVARS